MIVTSPPTASGHVDRNGVIARRQRPAEMLVSGHIVTEDGWPLRRFSLDPQGEVKGRILFLGGRGDFFEKYLEAYIHWRDLGWSVTGFDWRGQGGSGQTHEDAMCHVDDFGLLVRDLADVFAHWRSDPALPHVVIGHSMGGHILLRACAEKLITPDGIVLSAPMQGIKAGPLGRRSLKSLSRIGDLPPLRRRPIWRESRSPAEGRVTSCPDRHADKIWWKQAEPALARGGPTWGWLAAATRSIAKLDAVLLHDPPDMPALILSGANDPIVDNRAIAHTATRLPDCEYRLIGDGGHEILRERDKPREAAQSAIAAFLQRLATAETG